MTKIRAIENIAFEGHRTIRRGGGLKISVVSNGTGAPHVAGSLFYSSATAGAYMMIDNTGTGIQIG